MDYLQYYLTHKVLNLNFLIRFKPCYKWITFNTLTEGIDAVFMVERSHFYMVAKTIHFSVF